eukprot:3247847-Pleurochrysis_carterae.AAC.1
MQSRPGYASRAAFTAPAEATDAVNNDAISRSSARMSACLPTSSPTYHSTCRPGRLNTAELLDVGLFSQYTMLSSLLASKGMCAVGRSALKRKQSGHGKFVGKFVTRWKKRTQRRQRTRQRDCE